MRICIRAVRIERKRKYEFATWVAEKMTVTLIAGYLRPESVFGEGGTWIF